MYGIDSVQARVDAYRGNPQALEKKYQMSKELIDLLALQKLKTEREAAAREMQLEMAGQQGQPATVAQQREQEALETNKQELMQQQGALMQQQTAQRNQNLQNVMSGNAPRMAAAAPQGGGLPNLPAPNVATPKAMAAGGIVAFADGDYVDPKQYANYDPANPTQAQDRLNSFREYFKDKYGFDPEAGGLQGLGTRIAGAMGGTSEAAVDLDKYRAMKEGTQNLQRATAPRVPSPVAAAARQAAPQEEEPAPARAPQARPAPAAAPGGAPAAPTGGLGNLGGILSGLMQKSLDPEARAKAAEQERGVAEKYMMPTEEETARRKQMLADVQARNKELYDPERLRDESLTRGLLAAAGRSTIGQTLAGAGLGSLNYDIKMRELARQRMGEEQKQEEEMMGKTQKGREDVYKAGQTAAKEEGDIQKQGMASAAGIVSSQIAAAASMANAAAAREANAIQRESMTQNQALGRYDNAIKGEQEGIIAVNKAADKLKSEVQYLPEKERKAALAQIESDRELGIAEVRRLWQPAQQAAAAKAGISAPKSSPTGSKGFTLESVTK